MKDFARSESRAVQAQLDRLAALSVPDGRLGLDAVRTLLARLGDPQDRLPPVFHVAGTNGKGSTCALLTAMLEAQGLRVHRTTSPHLVRYNERIRLAGADIEDAALANLLAEALDAAAGKSDSGADEDNAALAVSFFEVTIAAAFLAFARTPADACVVEVGLGGRFDATNALSAPAACAIAALGIDHERFLLAPEDGVPTAPLARIAFEKAGIAKPGSPLVTLSYPSDMASEIARVAMAAGAPLAMAGRDWHWSATETGLHYADRHGELALPLPELPGAHQAANAALAIAILRHQDRVRVDRAAIAHGLRSARWPARLHRLAPSPLTGDRIVWLDGGHNPSAGAALAQHFAGARLHLILGMLANKDPAAIAEPLAPAIASLTVVPVPGHDHHAAAAFGPETRMADSVPDALAALPPDGLPVLIAGSLYLAGEVLRLDGALD